MSEQQQGSPRGAVVTEATLVKGGASKVKSLSASIAEQVRAGRATMRNIAEQVIALRALYVRPDGMPDIDGRSEQYRTAWGKALDACGFDGERERKTFISAVKYHVDKLYAEGSTPLETVTVKLETLDKSKLKERGLLPEPDADGNFPETVTLTPNEQLTYRGLSAEQQNAAAEARQASTERRRADAASAASAIGGSTADNIGEQLQSRVSSIMGERGANVDEARTYAKSAVIGTLRTLSLADAGEVLMAASEWFAEQVTAAEQVATPDRIRAIMSNVIGHASAVVEKLDKTGETAEQVVAAEQVA